MTFKELQDEVIALRFNEGKRASVKSWLNLRYSALWDHADWAFRHVSDAALAISANDRTPTMPPEFGRDEGIYDEQGERLLYLSPRLWRYQYQGDTATGTPEAYTVIDRQIQLGPIPSSSFAFTHAYERRLAHIDAGGGAVGGIMVEDGDQPLWPAEHDYVLVLDAGILGQQLEKDDGWQMLVPQRDELLRGMVAALVGGSAEPVFWGVG